MKRGDSPTAATTRVGDDTVVRTSDLGRRYHGAVAVREVTAEIRKGSITGLIGRNGSGKTTLLKLLAGHEFPSSGTVEVFGAPPAENPFVQRRMILVREDQKYPDFRVCHAIQAAGLSFPNWDVDFAHSLLAEFELDGSRKIKRLSRGMRSVVGIVIGLASRAELTLFDEPYAGLDPVARQIFYDRLLADYAEHPRTVMLSTHHVDEAAGLLENLMVLDRGRLALSAPTDEIRGSATAVVGPREHVAEFTSGRVVWHIERLGAHSRAVVGGPLTEGDRAELRDLALRVEPVTVQQTVAYQTSLRHSDGEADGDGIGAADSGGRGDLRSDVRDGAGRPASGTSEVSS